MSRRNKPRVRVFVGREGQVATLSRYKSKSRWSFAPRDLLASMRRNFVWGAYVLVIDRGGEPRERFPQHWRHADDDAPLSA